MVKSCVSRNPVCDLELKDDDGVVTSIIGDLVSVYVDSRRILARRRNLCASSSAFPISMKASLTGGGRLALGMFEINSGLFPYLALSLGRRKRPYANKDTATGTIGFHVNTWIGARPALGLIMAEPQ